MSIDEIGGEVIEQKIVCFLFLSMLSIEFLVFKIYIDFFK